MFKLLFFKNLELLVKFKVLINTQFKLINFEIIEYSGISDDILIKISPKTFNFTNKRWERGIN